MKARKSISTQTGKTTRRNLTANLAIASLLAVGSLSALAAGPTFQASRLVLEFEKGLVVFPRSGGKFVIDSIRPELEMSLADLMILIPSCHEVHLETEYGRDDADGVQHYGGVYDIRCDVRRD